MKTRYSSTPKSALITAAAVTPEKRSNAISAAETFLDLGTSIKARIKELGGDTLAGVYVSPILGRLKPLYICTIGSVGVADGGTEQRFVSQGANDGSTLQPESAPLDIVNNVVFLHEVGSAPLPDLWSSNAGAKFTKADLANATSVQALIPDESAEYQIVVAPRCLPIFFGQAESCRGKIDENSADILNAALPGSSLWAGWMSDWSADFQEAVLTTHSAKASVLGKKFPKMVKKCGPIAASAFTITETLYVDDDEVKPALDELRSRLFAAVPAAQPTPAAEVPVQEDLTVATALSSKPPPPSGNNNALGSVPRRNTFANFSDEDAQATKFRLTMLIYDEATGTIGIPELKDETEYLYYSLTTARKRNDQVEDILRSWTDECDASDDFLRRLYDPPALDQAAKALIVNSYLATRPMTDFDTTPKDKFRCYFFAADTLATSRSRDATKDDRDLEMMCGEDKTNLSRVNVTITCNHNVLAPEPFLVLLANRCGFIEATVVVSPQWDDVSNPLIYKFYRAIANSLTSHTARTWLKVTPAATLRRFYGWLLQMVDMYECFLATVSSHTRNLLSALCNEFSKISLEPVRKAEQLKNEVLTKILKIYTSTETVPTCSLITALDNKDAKKRLAEKPGTPAKAPKEPRTGPSDKEKADTTGCIVFKKKGIMPTPTEEDPTRRVCAAAVRQGTVCRRGDRCGSIHSLQPETWPVDILKTWVAHVEADSGMSWAPSVRMDLINAAIAKSAPAEGK